MYGESEFVRKREVRFHGNSRGGEHVAGDDGVRAAFESEFAGVPEEPATARETDVTVRDDEPVNGDEYQYTRSIGGHRHQKVGLGHPNEGKTK